MKYNKILVVDDDPNIREVLSILLESENYEVEEASNGSIAVEKVLGALEESSAFDLVVLDIMMPEMDGVEVCRKIREKSTVPILFLTAKSQDKDKVDAYTSDLSYFPLPQSCLQPLFIFRLNYMPEF